MLSKVKKLFEKLAGNSKEAPVEVEAVKEEEDLCCSGNVHIAYRGLADDRMYISYDRKWEELKYFRQNNLRVFCADCRRRVY